MNRPRMFARSAFATPFCRLQRGNSRVSCVGSRDHSDARSKYWCFTSFTVAPEPVRQPEVFEYFVFGRESCPESLTFRDMWFLKTARGSQQLRRFYQLLILRYLAVRLRRLRTIARKMAISQNMADSNV
ncbi:hypothetical protein CDAR_220911 [Caerostris darwini]|uniref:Uncharacterized protein n=1 Tax=Caerostris darwini TaxID=1538125 RepID=A0AAV4MVD8_9ARAC|nr:hypothetical protein CDAR_220911 [Caerostris darwini]